MRLRAYVVDDEPLDIARRATCSLLDETGRVEVIGSTTDSEEAVEALASTPPDVCFLDIHMPRLNGFEVLARLPAQPIVLFTTAHDQARSDLGVRGELGRLPAQTRRSRPPGFRRSAGWNGCAAASTCRRPTCRGSCGRWRICCGAPGPSIRSASRHAWASACGSSIWST